MPLAIKRKKDSLGLFLLGFDHRKRPNEFEPDSKYSIEL
jgi:hypothetical protein